MAELPVGIVNVYVLYVVDTVASSKFVAASVIVVGSQDD